MKVQFWGTRGSLPKAFLHQDATDYVENFLRDCLRKGVSQIDRAIEELRVNPRGLIHFGGCTSCTEFSHEDTHILVDSGTGIVKASEQTWAKKAKEFHLFQTHFHWDHIMGFPFFLQAYQAGVTIHIYTAHKTGERDFKIQFNGSNFPVKWEDLPSQIIFHHLKLYQPIKVGSFEVTPFVLDHPGGSFGYHFVTNDAKVSIGVDGEFKRKTKSELGKDHPYYQNLDLFIYDGQYNLEELASRHDWGHSSPVIGTEIALREKIKAMAFTHHDPRSSDEKILSLLQNAKTYLCDNWFKYKADWQQHQLQDAPLLFSAHDGLLLEVTKKGIVQA